MLRAMPSGVATRLTLDAADDINPVWSPDGQFIYYTSIQTGSVPTIFRKRANGVGSAERVDTSTVMQRTITISPDGKFLFYRRQTPDKPGDALYFSHGFSIVYKEQTGIIPPPNVDVVLVAPKGSGRTVRTNFLNGSGINASFAVFQDYTGHAREKTLALGIAIGSGYLFPTTFEREVVSDLTGERGILMGALAGVMEAQYTLLRKHGHTPSEAFNETVEELTQSLIRLVDENGMDWMYSNCSATAQRGALDWKPRFKKAVLPVFKELYQRVKTGKECTRVLSACGRPDYQKQLTKELAAIGNSEMWTAGKAVRALRPKEPAKAIAKGTKGVSGRTTN